MSGEAERLELVTDFGSLRAGVLVVVKGCEWCNGGSHRGMLFDHFGNHEPLYVLDPTPKSPCRGRSGYAIQKSSVDAGYVFRLVVPDADKALDYSVERPRVVAK